MDILRPNTDLIAGVDEVGRGPLVGDVVTAAVILDPNKPISGLADSKKLTDKKRQALSIEIKEKSFIFDNFHSNEIKHLCGQTRN